MSGITIIGLQPTDIVAYRASAPYDEIRTYQIGKYVIRIGIHSLSLEHQLYGIGEHLDLNGGPLRMDGLIGWSYHPDGDHLGSPYWSLSNIIYGLARIWDDLYPGMVRWDPPNTGEWNRDAMNRMEGGAEMEGG